MMLSAAIFTYNVLSDEFAFSEDLSSKTRELWRDSEVTSLGVHSNLYRCIYISVHWFSLKWVCRAAAQLTHFLVESRSC